MPCRDAFDSSLTCAPRPRRCLLRLAGVRETFAGGQRSDRGEASDEPQHMKLDPFEIVGTMLDGRYRVDEVVGEGGFGVVYRGFHPGFDAPIAIKVLKMPHGLKPEEREELLATFHQEGKLLFTLSKLTATFVQVMEKGVLQRQGMPIAPYLVLEWLDGRTLDADMRERRARGQGRCSLDEGSGPIGVAARSRAGGRRVHGPCSTGRRGFEYGCAGSGSRAVVRGGGGARARRVDSGHLAASKARFASGERCPDGGERGAWRGAAAQRRASVRSAEHGATPVDVGGPDASCRGDPGGRALRPFGRSCGVLRRVCGLGGLPAEVGLQGWQEVRARRVQARRVHREPGLQWSAGVQQEPEQVRVVGARVARAVRRGRSSWTAVGDRS